MPLDVLDGVVGVVGRGVLVSTSLGWRNGASLEMILHGASADL